MLDFRASKNKNIPKRTTYDEGSERMDGPTYL